MQGKNAKWRLSFCAMWVACLAGPSAWADSRIPGTLNFIDETAARIPVFEVESAAPNEKFIDLGDFDADGDLDVAIASAFGDFGTKRNKFYRNNGGVLAPGNNAHITGFNTARTTRNVFFLFANNDAHLDLLEVNDGNNAGATGDTIVYLSGGPPGYVFAQQTSSTSFAFAAGNSLGGFSAWRHPICSTEARDFDNDGDEDIYWGNYPNQSQDAVGKNNDNAAGSFAVYGAGASGLVPTDSSYSVDIGTADLNNDGTLDIIQSNISSTLVRLYWNDPVVDGDFANIGATTLVSGSNPAGTQPAAQPADLNNDGWQDVVVVNRAGDNTANRLAAYVNNAAAGLDGSGRATFNEVSLVGNIPSVNSVEGKKVTFSDLDADGWLDLLVQSDHDSDDGTDTGVNGLKVLRNVTTSVGGTPKFIEWSPNAIVRNGTTSSKGWQARAFDLAVDGDVYPDILNGVETNEKVYRNVPGQEFLEPAGANPHTLPGSFGQTIVISGTTGSGDTDVYDLPSVPANATISAVLKGSVDYTLVARNPSNVINFTSNSGGVGQIEAGQANVGAASGTWKVEVTNNGGGGSAFAVNGPACNPPDGYIDPRQDRALLAGPAQGITSFTVVFNSAVTLTTGDVSVTTTGGTTPIVTSVSGGGTTWTVNLNGPIPVGHRTRFTFGTGSGNTLAYGFLPSDVNASGSVSTSDASALATALASGTGTLLQHDINRTASLAALDLLRGVQLMNGINTVQAWLGETLPTLPPVGGSDSYVLEVLVRTLP